MTFELPDAVQMANVTSAFYACLDDRDYDGALSCLTEDALWVRRGVEVLQGRAAIEKTLRSRPDNFHTRHLVTNVRVRQTSETEGEVNFYMMGLPHIGDIPENGHVPVPHPHLLIVYRDTMRRVDGRWLIAEKRPLKTAFKSDMQLP